MQLKKKLVWSAMFTATLGLTACGGSSGGSSSAVGSLSGIVADGYLGNATVCLDLNENKLCDDNEPSAITEDGTGAYTIEATQSHINNIPILVVTTTRTTDSDLNGAAIEHPFTLSSPAGKGAFISPLTTKVQAKIEEVPALTVEQAESAVKNDLGLSNPEQVSLFENFVEKGQAGDNVYKALHQTSQIIARTMGGLKAQWGVDLNTNDEALLQKQIIREVTMQLDVLYYDATMQIETEGDVSVEAAQRVANATIAAAPPSEQIATQIENDREDIVVGNTRSTTLLSAVTAQNGLALMQYDIDDEVGELNTTLFLSNRNGGIIMHQSDEEWTEAWLDNMLTEQDVKNDIVHPNHQANYNALPMTIDSDGKPSFLGRDGEATVQIQKVDMVNLNGLTKLLKDVMGDYESNETKTVTFGEGDINYRIPFIETMSDSGAVSSGIFSSYNLSAIKRIHEAAAQ